MKHKRLYFIALGAFALASLFIPTSVAYAAKMSPGIIARQQVGPDWSFPCSDVPGGPAGGIQPSEQVISQDWLSGDVVVVQADGPAGRGHLLYTFIEDTLGLPQITTLFEVMEGLGFLLIAPSIMLLGYQLMIGASTFRYAGALEGLSSIALGVVGVGVSFQLVQLLIQLENRSAAAILALHVGHPFSALYNLAGEPAASYRGIVIPMSRWGCHINDFIGIFSQTFVEDTLGSVIPLIGGLGHLAGVVTNISDLIHRCGEMVLVILSFLLWVQIFVRIVLINYYILMTPLAFGCWALPGGVGQRVVHLWSKGFFTVLFVQIAQGFVITTLPLLLPNLPQVGPDNVGIWRALLLAFPPVLALWATVMTPRLFDATLSQAFGTAGAMAEGVTVAIRTAVSQRREAGEGTY